MDRTVTAAMDSMRRVTAKAMETRTRPRSESLSVISSLPAKALEAEAWIPWGCGGKSLFDDRTGGLFPRFLLHALELELLRALPVYHALGSTAQSLHVSRYVMESNETCCHVPVLKLVPITGRGNFPIVHAYLSDMVT